MLYYIIKLKGHAMRIARAPLTEKQENVYNFIVGYIKKNRYSPTIREIQRNFNFKAANTVIHYIGVLKEKGYITLPSFNKNGATSPSSRARTISLVDDILGNHYIKPQELGLALKKLRERGYSIETNEAVELLKSLNIFIE
jgi:repressor LexA